MARLPNGIRINIRPSALVGSVGDIVARNLDIVGVFLRDEAKKKLNRGQPTRTLPSGSIIGLDPSLPGEPPKKITGQLQNSIRHKIVRRPGYISCLLGTDLKKARWLEFGTSKMAARPFLRPTIAENRRNIIQIVAGGMGAVPKAGGK